MESENLDLLSSFCYLLESHGFNFIFFPETQFLTSKMSVIMLDLLTNKVVVRTKSIALCMCV